MLRNRSAWLVGLAAVTLIAAAGSTVSPGTSVSGVAAGDSDQAWFSRNLDYTTREGGRWLTDNARYVGPDEPWVSYGIEWKKGVSGRTAHGRLFGVDGNGAERNFWELYSYWDPLRETAVALQVHPAGIFGLGDLTWLSAREHEIVQTFHQLDGATSQVRHLERASGDSLYSQSFDWTDGSWQPRRSYVWVRGR